MQILCLLCVFLLFSPILCVLTNDGPIENGKEQEAEKHSNSDANLRTVSSKFGRVLTGVGLGALVLQAQLTQGAIPLTDQSNNGVQNYPKIQNSSTTNTFQVTNHSQIPLNYSFNIHPRIPNFNDSRHLKEIEKEFLMNEKDQNETSVVSETGKKHKDKLIVYHNVTDGCSLIKCSNGSACAIRTGMASLGNGMFEHFEYPKCIMDPYQLSHNTDPDGNSHIKKNGPGCNLVKCAEVDGFYCHVRISVSKLGNRPYAQVLGGFPQCVHSSKAYDESTNIVMEGGPGCDKIQCFNGEKCKVSVGIAKYGNSKWSQFFWPYCA
uniref:Secreted protein n=1 Tax=Globodera rostochiensis TaxID=31243 RepID=A0A914HZZ8_GLORO